MGLLDRRAEADARRPGGRTPNGGPPPALAAAVKWEDPVPLPSSDAVPPFPVETLPPSLAGFVSSLADVTATPPDFAATYLLGVSAGLIGATRAVRIGPGWAELSVLYAVVVAEKSAGKTPVFSAVMRPVNQAQAKLAAERRQQDKQDASNPAAKHNREAPRLVYVKDFTVESLAPVLAAHPRGLLVARDEVSGWASSFNQYKSKGSGSDRQFWLGNWGSEPMDVLRRNPEAPHVHVAYPCTSIVGGIQPAVLGDLRQDRDDGMIERLIFAFPDRLPAVGYSRKAIEGQDDWARLARRMLALSMTDPDEAKGEYGPRPFYYLLDETAELAFDCWTQVIADQCNDPDRLPAFDGARTKMKSLVARLALVLHVLWGLEAGDLVDAKIPGEVMDRAILLGRYYLAHAARAHGVAGADDRPARVLDWVKRHGKPFSRRDAHRALIRQFPKAEMLASPLNVLANHGYIRTVREANADPRSQTVYAIHPQLVIAVNNLSAPGADRLSAEPGAA